MNVHCVEILSILTNTETGDENKKPVMKTTNRRLTQKPVMKTRNRSFFSNAYLHTFFMTRLLISTSTNFWTNILQLHDLSLQNITKRQI